MTNLDSDSLHTPSEFSPPPGPGSRGRLARLLLGLLLVCPVLNYFAVQQPEGLMADFASNGAQALAAMLGAFFLLRAQYLSEESAQRCRWAWWMISLGGCCNAAASMIYLLMVWFELPKFPSPADFFLVSFSLCTLVGLWLLPRREAGRMERLRLTFVIGCAVLLGGVIFSNFLWDGVHAFYETAKLPHKLLASLYLSLDLSLVLSSFWALARRDRGQVVLPPILALFAGSLLLMSADLLQVQFMATRIHFCRVVVEHAWCLVSVCLGLVGYLRFRRPAA